MEHHEQPVDPDAPDPGYRGHVLVAVALGGGLGSAARWGLAELLGSGARFPWATFAANASGALLLGVLMVLVLDVWPEHPTLRPFVGVGVLGGYTTFSTYAVETRDLLAGADYAVAATYALGSVAAGLAAVWLGLAATRLILDRSGVR